ncbi:MAG: hypothetical protein ACYSWS_05940 [Planctomycetota bacterium]
MKNLKELREEYVEAQVAFDLALAGEKRIKNNSASITSLKESLRDRLIAEEALDAAKKNYETRRKRMV